MEMGRSGAETERCGWEKWIVLARCINAELGLRKRRGLLGYRNHSIWLAPKGHWYPHKEKKKSHCCLQPGAAKLGREGRKGMRERKRRENETERERLRSISSFNILRCWEQTWRCCNSLCCNTDETWGGKKKKAGEQKWSKSRESYIQVRWENGNDWWRKEQNEDWQ